jgi:arsenate reductase
LDKHLPMNKPVSNNTIMLYYVPDCPKAKKALVYAKSISSGVMQIDLTKSFGTPTIWRQVFSSLGKTPKQVLNKSLPEYQAMYRGREMSMEDWINVIRHTPGLIRSPIAIRGNRGVILDNPTDIYRLQ